jgi:hypothetical protein
MKRKLFIPTIALLSFLPGCQKDYDADPIPPVAPTELVAEAKSSSQIALTWKDNATNEEGFRVERKTGNAAFTQIADLGKDITFFLDQGLTKNTTYTYRIYSYNPDGKSAVYSNTADATTSDDLPATATNLKATTVAFNQVDLDWTDQATNETGYRIERKTGTSSFTFLATVDPNTTRFSDKDLEELATFTYRVIPYNTSGNGAPSNEATASTGANITSALAAYYSFSGNALDSSGNNNHGSINGNVTLTTDRKGKAGSAYAFGGNEGSFINVPMSASLRIRNQITLAAWIYMDGGFYNPRILSNEATGFDRYLMSVAGTGNTSRILEASMAGQTQGSGFCCGGANGIQVSALAWHFIVFTVDSSGMASLYLDGELKKTEKGTLLTNPNYGPNLNIGRNSHPAYDAWGGKLDDIRIYSRALTAKQINYLYNN